MTVSEVIKCVIPALESIKVPVTELDTIGRPVAAAINDLRKCVEFMDRVAQEAAEKAAQEAAADEERAQAEAAAEQAQPAAAEAAPEDPEDLFGEKDAETERKGGDGA